MENWAISTREGTSPRRDSPRTNGRRDPHPSNNTPKGMLPKHERRLSTPLCIRPIYHPLFRFNLIRRHRTAEFIEDRHQVLRDLECIPVLDLKPRYKVNELGILEQRHRG